MGNGQVEESEAEESEIEEIKVGSSPNSVAL